MNDSVRVATLNLWGEFAAWPSRLRLLKRIWEREVGADVLLLQEVCSRPGFDQAARTAQALGYAHHAQAMTSGDLDLQEGVAILSRLALSDVSVQLLPDSIPGRALLTAAVQTPSGAQLRVASAHTVFAPEPTRRSQMDAIARLLDHKATVLGTDLNTTPAEMEHSGIDWRGLTDPFDGDEVCTWPNDGEALRKAWLERVGREPMFDMIPRRLDYLLVRGVKVSERGCSPLMGAPGRHVSDHAALWVDVAV